VTATMSDLSALTAPNYAGDFVNAFKIGEGWRLQVVRADPLSTNLPTP